MKKNHSQIEIVAYAVVGYPTLEDSFAWMCRLIEMGVTTLEIGIPAQHPHADGATIQVAHKNALKNVSGFVESCEVAKRIHALYPQIHLVMCSYKEPLDIYTFDEVCQYAKASGFSAFLWIDLPLEALKEMTPAFEKYQLKYVPLIPPSTPLSFIQELEHTPHIYALYGITTQGRTGSAISNLHDSASQLKSIAQNTPYPVWAGFGIRSLTQAQPFLESNLSIVIGSALVEQQGVMNIEEARTVIAPIRAFIDTTQ